MLAATNRPDVLDPALLRPGRFDRHVTLELPDKVARLAILRVHTRKVPLGPDADLGQVAAGTPGFSGADLKNLVNEAAMMAAREGQATVRQRHLDEMREKLLMGSVRTLAIQPEQRRRLAVHEAEHTTVAHFLPHADPLYKVFDHPTRPRARHHPSAARGGAAHPARGVFQGPARGHDGRAGGGEADPGRRQLRRRRRHPPGDRARPGHGRALGHGRGGGPVDLRQSEEHPFLGREIAQPRLFSQETAHEIDEAVRRLITDAEQRATEVVSGYRAQVEHLIEELEGHETLDRAAIDACLGPARERQGTDVKPVTAAA